LKSKEDMTVPLKKEEVNLSKTPCVKEGVTVKKNPVLESRQVSGGVTSKKINTSYVE
jgi:uncharacterized protein (TIGR02271 family)